MDRATIRQKKTGRPVRFELTDHSRVAIDEYLRLMGASQASFYSPAGVTAGAARPPGNMPGSCKSGWPALA